MADFTKIELETILKDTQEHLAETQRLGPGYYRIRERYDYAVEADERYIEKLEKQIAEFDQDKLNENQQIVLEWLKSRVEAGYSCFDAVQSIRGFNSVPGKVLNAYMMLDEKEKRQVLAAFSEWGLSNEKTIRILESYLAFRATGHERPGIEKAIQILKEVAE